MPKYSPVISATPIVVAEFCNGELSSKYPDMSVGLFQSKSDSSKKMLVGEMNNNCYIGFDNGPSKSKQPCRHYVAIRRKSTGKISIHDAEMFQLVRDNGPKTLFEAIDSSASVSKKSKREREDILTAAFGSAKKQRAMRSRHLNKIESVALDAAMDASMLQKVVCEEDVFSKSYSQSSEQNELLPSHNKDALRVEDVYSFHGLITSAEYEAMRGIAQGLFNATSEEVSRWKMENKYGQFVLNRVMVMPTHEERRLDQSIKLAYLNIMMLFYKMKSIDLRKKDPFTADVPLCVKNKLMSEFTVTTSLANGRMMRTRTNRLKDKLLLHILILALITDDYRLHIEDLMMDLKMNRKTITNYLRAVGAQVKKSIETIMSSKVENFVATISIPVQFPEVKILPEKKRFK